MVINKTIAVYTPAITSSNITPKPFFIFLSTLYIGYGLAMSKNLNRIKEIKAYIIKLKISPFGSKL